MLRELHLLPLDMWKDDKKMVLHIVYGVTGHNDF